MKIGMILDQKFPPDIRVEKEGRTLVKAGYEVYLLCVSAPNLPDEDVYEGIKLRRCNFYPKHWVARNFTVLTSRIAFKNKFLIPRIEKFIDENSIDVLHVHDLPMVRSGLIAAKKKQIPVIADLHENYPAAIQYFLEGRRFRSKLFRSSVKKWKKYEADCLDKVHHIIVVIDEAKERIIKDYNLPPDKVTIVSNTVDVNFFDRIPLDNNLINSYRDDFIISYIGGFGPHRGLDVPIRAMPKLIKEIPNVKLLLVGGRGGKIQQDLERLADNLGFAESVIFTGWQPSDLLPSYIALSDICLVPHHSNPHTDTTIPHKLFQYMLLKKPVIVSNCIPLARIVNETQAGLVFESGNSDDFAKTCLELLDADKRKQFGENGRRAVLAKYNFEKAGENLVKVYENIRNTR